MEKYKISQENNFLRIEVFKTRTNIISLCILLSLALFIFIIPILVLIFLILSDEGGLSFGFLITIALSLFASGYLMKLYLWNKYGKDVFEINNGIVKYYCDYKYFKDAHKEYPFDELNLKFENADGTPVNLEEKDLPINDKELSRLCFDLGEIQIRSHNMLSISEIIEIGSRVNNFLSLDQR